MTVTGVSRPTLGIGTAASGTSEAAALGASASVLSASRSFFRDRTTLTPLSRPVAVSLADPSGGPVLSRFSTVLPCPAAPSGTLTGLYLPSFSTNLVSGADLQDAGVHHVLPLTPPSFLRQRPRLQTLHMDVWGPARVRGQGQERYFLLVGDDYSRYTTVFPLRSKGEVTAVLIDWIRAAHLHASGLTGSRMGLLSAALAWSLDVARTSMMHAAAPHFLWPFAVRYAAHQINLHPRVSRPETSPALLWTGKVGDASAFRVWGSRAFVRDLSADKLSPRASPCVFLGFPPDAPGWQFYHPTSRRVLSSQDVTFDESVPYYASSPTALRPSPPPPLFLTRSSLSRSLVTLVLLRELSLGVRKSGGAEPGGAESGGAEPGGAEPGGAVLGVLSLEVPSLGVLCLGVLGLGVLSLEVPCLGELRAWFAGRWRRAAGAGGSSAAEGTAAARPAGARTVGAGAAESESSPGAGPAEGVGAELPLAARLTVLLVLRLEVLELLVVLLEVLLEWVLLPGLLVLFLLVRSLSGHSHSYSLPPLCLLLLPTLVRLEVLTERREPASRPVSPVRTERASGRGSRQRPPPVPGTHRMSLRPSTAPLRAPLPSPPASSLPALADPESDALRAASPTVTRLLATAVTDPSFESSAASALVTELVDFAARCRLDYAARLVTESESACPPSVGGECALGTDVLEGQAGGVPVSGRRFTSSRVCTASPEGDPDAPDIPTPRSYAEAIEWSLLLSVAGSYGCRDGFLEVHRHLR
ncbi:unnamed protein product [Closterium sp. NIES-64]|nr:unnamed protein product [Closterium sp. NIES-64]